MLTHFITSPGRRISTSGFKPLMRALAGFLLLMGASHPAWASFSLVANGVVTQLPTGLSTIDTLSGAVLDLNGNLYVADSSSNEIIKIAADQVTTSVLSITGLGTPTLSSPRGLAIDSSGNLYIADTGHNRIVEVSASGAGSVISTSAITLNAPQGVSVDVSGDIYISDTGNSRIVKIPTGGTAAVFSISGLSPVLSNQRGLAIDPQGNLYIADTGNSRVVKVSSTGTAGTILTTAAGTALDGPSGVAVGNNGVLYIADTNTTEDGNPTPGRVVIVDSQGNARELLTGYPVFNSPLAVAVSPMGKLYVLDNGGTANAGRVQSFQSYTIDTSDSFTSSVGFKNVQLGSAGTSITIPFDVGSGITLPSIKIYTAGTQNLDFTIANDSTCVTGSTYANNTDCTVDVTFSPTATGLRKGALVLNYGYGSLTVPLYAVADAPVAAITPSVASVINIGSTTLSSPFQAAVDGAGNTYVTNYGSNIVVKIPAGGGTGTAVSTGSFTLSQPTGVAVDASGNLFIADYGNSRIVEMSNAGTASLFAISGLSSSIDQPTALAFDGAGNLYITDYGRGRMVEVTPYGQGSVLATGSVSFVTTSITGSTVDAVGNVYIADRTESRIVKVDPLGNTTVLSFSSVGALSSPEGVAVDPSGNLYVMDSINQRIIRITTSGATAVLPFSGVTIGSFIFGITPDSNGNILVADWSNNRLVKVNVGQSALAYASTNVGSTSSDSPKTATVTDLGDQPLVLSAAPTYTTSFSENNGDTNLCTPTTTLLSGTGCDVSIKFTPQTAGSLTANVTVTSNTLNVANSTQQIAVSGTGINAGDSTATTLTLLPTSASYGQSITITAKVSDTTTGRTSTVPTGSVTFIDTVGSTVTELNNVSPVTLNSSGNAVLTGVVLNGVGTHTISANYSGVSSTFLASTTSGTIAVSQTAVTVAGPATQPVSVTVGQTGSVAVTVTGTYTGSSVPSGTLSYSILNSSGTSVLSGTATLTAATGGATATVPVPSTLAAGSYTISLAYGGDSNYQTTASATVLTLHIEQITPTITWTSSGAITYGTSLGGLLTATASNVSNTVPGTFTYTATVAGGSPVAVNAGSVLGAGTYTLTATFTPTDTTTYATATNTATLTVAQAGVSATLVSSANPSIVTNPVTFTAAVISSIGAPTGNIAFFNGATLLGTVALSQGQAAFTTSALTLGTQSITAVYAGDGNFAGATTAAVAEVVQDFTLSSSGSSGTGSGTTPTATIVPGGTATYTLSFGPSGGTVFPNPVTLSLSGLPPGATGMLSPQTLPAGSSLTSVTLTIQLPEQTSELRKDMRLAVPALALILLPFAGRMRRAGRGLQKLGCLLTLLMAGVAVAGLSGCGSKGDGFLGQQNQSYTVVITATSGTLSHSTSVTLNVQ